MKLSDVMSSMGLSAYAQISLVIFFAVFLAVVFHVYRKDLQSHWEQASRMPLDDENPQDPRDRKENG